MRWLLEGTNIPPAFVSAAARLRPRPVCRPRTARAPLPGEMAGSARRAGTVLHKAGLSTRAIRSCLASFKCRFRAGLGVLRYSPMILINTRLRRPPSNSP
jgi:hypothetical protein